MGLEQHDVSHPPPVTPFSVIYNVNSVRANIQNGHQDFDTSNEFFMRGFYLDLRGDPSDVEKDYLKSPLLVKVRLSFTVLHFHTIYTTSQPGRWS